MVAKPASEGSKLKPGAEPTWLALLAFGLVTRIALVVLGCFLARPETSLTSVAARAPYNDAMNPRHLAALSIGSRRWIELLVSLGRDVVPGHQPARLFFTGKTPRAAWPSCRSYHS